MTPETAKSKRGAPSQELLFPCSRYVAEKGRRQLACVLGLFPALFKPCRCCGWNSDGLQKGDPGSGLSAAAPSSVAAWESLSLSESPFSVRGRWRGQSGLPGPSSSVVSSGLTPPAASPTLGAGLGLNSQSSSQHGRPRASGSVHPSWTRPKLGGRSWERSHALRTP